jgi:hypothetical protein
MFAEAFSSFNSNHPLSWLSRKPNPRPATKFASAARRFYFVASPSDRKIDVLAPISLNSFAINSS